MSETMIERVARAIAPAHFEDWQRSHDYEMRMSGDEVEAKRFADWIAPWSGPLMSARAAIEAMRTPTEEMITAAVEATSEQVDWVNGLFGGSYDNATQVFSDAHTAAIDAALKEQTK